MADILLIHGASHGAWCWREVIPELADLGHSAIAIDLPSHGDDPTPVNDVTLDSYADAIIAALETPKVIVGHSMAGYPISLVAERRPDLVQRLIYLCAYVPKAGYTLSEMRKLADRQPLAPAFQLANDRRSFTFEPTMLKDCFYSDCTDEQLAFARSRLTPQAVAPNEECVELTDRYDSVPRNYIRCTEDGAIPYELQVSLTEGWQDANVVDMQCSHSPFFSRPDSLAVQIDQFIPT